MAYDANYPADNITLAQGPAAIRNKGADLKALIDGLDDTKLNKANKTSTYGYHYRDVVGYSTQNAGANTTGTLKITLPVSWTNTMLNITIKGYEHLVGSNWFVEVSGYNAVSPGWTQPCATLSPNCPFTSVRFAHDGAKCCILLGTTSTVWQFPQIVVSAVLASYSGGNLFGTGWGMAFITSETGITVSGNPKVSTLATTSDNSTGNSATATKLTTARTIAITGKVTGTATSFDGSANISINTTAVTADNSDTVDGKHASDFEPIHPTGVFFVGGDASTFYPIIFRGNYSYNGYANKLVIKRHTHQDGTNLGGAWLEAEWSAGEWGVNGTFWSVKNCYIGNPHVSDFSVAINDLAFVVWLKGQRTYYWGGSLGVSLYDYNAVASKTLASQTFNSKTSVNKTEGYFYNGGRLVTDVSASFTQSLSANGWTKLPNGLIMQWVKSTSNTTITFPITFPNGVLSVSHAYEGGYTAAISAQYYAIGTLSNSGFTLNSAMTSLDSTSKYHWLAIGY